MSEMLVRLLRYSYERVAFTFFKESQEKNMDNHVNRKLTLRNVFMKDLEVKNSVSSTQAKNEIYFEL